MRNRSQGFAAYRYQEIPGVDFSVNQYSETFYESRYPGSNSCLHIKQLPGTGSGVSLINGRPILIENQLCPFSLSQLYEPLGSATTSLNWNKLPTSTQSGLIQILAELDDTLALFTRKFWRQLSYGSFTWGVLPFVSDLKAVLQAIANLSANLSSFPYEDAQIVPVDINYVHDAYNRHTFNGEAVVRMTGNADISYLDGATQWLDRLGFHPDLATAWDLVPLSFLVDYVLPVGDFLESLRGGGWVKTARFTGWCTIKLVGTYSVKHHSVQLSGQYRSFQRWASSSILTVPEEAFQLSLELPSLKELFNILYVTLSRR